MRGKTGTGGTSLGGALWGLLNATPDTPAERYVGVIELLVASGAIVPRTFVQWWQDVEAVSPEVHAAVLSMLSNKAVPRATRRAR